MKLFLPVMKENYNRGCKQTPMDNFVYPNIVMHYDLDFATLEKISFGMCLA